MSEKVKIDPLDKLYTYLQLILHGYSAVDANKMIDKAVKKLESGDTDD